MVLGFLFGKKKGSSDSWRGTTGFLKPYDRQHIASDWVRIEQLVASGIPSALKEAVITSDKLMDYALSQITNGETMGERLKNSNRAFPWEVYQGIWDAHKMRNALVHDANFDLTVLVAREVVSKFKKGFQSLGVEI